jgi:hypothetical protein
MCRLNSIFTALTKNENHVCFSSIEYTIKARKTYEFFYYVRLENYSSYNLT